MYWLVRALAHWRVSGKRPAKRAASQACGVMVISARPWRRRGRCGWRRIGGDGDAGGGGGEDEPAALGFDVADELGVVFAAGAHEAGADGGDADAFVAQLGVQAFGEADEGELGGGVGQHVRHGDLAADARRC